MEFTVAKSDLVRELSLSQGVVEKKTTIPILSNVLLEAEGDRVVLTATDLELGIRCSCPARVKKEGAGTVPARKLLEYARLLPEGDVNMKFLENHWASITCGRSRTRIAGMSRESFPELPQMPEQIAEIPMKLLASMIARTSFAISMEESRFTLNGALLFLRPEGLTMVATDGHRLAYVQAASADSGQVNKQFRALIPKKALVELIKLAEEAGPDAKAIFAGDDNHLFFQVGNRLLMTRKLTGNFPDYERVLPKDHTLTAKLQRTRSVRQSSAWRSSRMSGRGPSGCSLPMARCGCSLPRWRWERAKRACQASTRVRIWRSASTRNTCWIFYARFRKIMCRSS